MAQKVSFSWGNYFKPTPTNLERISGGLRHIFTVVTGAMVLDNAPAVLTLSILGFGAFLDELTKFFGAVREDETTEQVTVRYPVELADQVEIVKETKDSAGETTGEETLN